MSTLIAIVNESTVVKAGDARKIASAVSQQVRSHLAPLWGITAPSVRYYPNVKQVPAGAQVVAILDDADQAGALGYHDETSAKAVYAKVFARTVLDNQGTVLTGPLSVAVTVSHEVLEMIGDPRVNEWADTLHGTSIAWELCDPVEDRAYDLDGVWVSDFACPDFFDPQARLGRYDYLNALTQPLSMTSGGYLIWRTEGAEQEKFAQHVANESLTPVGDGAVGAQVCWGPDYPEWRKAAKQGSNTRTHARTRRLAAKPANDVEPGTAYVSVVPDVSSLRTALAMSASLESTAPSRLSAVERVARTVVQVVLSVCAAVPLAASTAGVSAATAAKPVAIAGAVVILLTAVQNGIEAKTGVRLGLTRHT